MNVMEGNGCGERPIVALCGRISVTGVLRERQVLCGVLEELDPFALGCRDRRHAGKLRQPLYGQARGFDGGERRNPEGYVIHHRSIRAPGRLAPLQEDQHIGKHHDVDRTMRGRAPPERGPEPLVRLDVLDVIVKVAHCQASRVWRGQLSGRRPAREE